MMDEFSARLRRELAYNLVFGMVENVREVWEMVSQAGLKYPPNFATVWEIHNAEELFHGRSELWKVGWRRQVEKSFAGYFNHNALHCFVSDRALAVLFNNREWGKPGEENDQLNALKQGVEKSLAVKFFVGVGRVYSDARHLGLSFNEAWRAIRRVFCGVPGIYYFGDGSARDREPFLERERAALKYAILNDDRQKALRIVQEIKMVLAAFGEGDLNILKMMVFEMLSLVMTACMENGRSADQVFIHALEWIKQLHLAEDAGKMAEIWSEACKRVLLNTNNDHSLEIQVVARARRFMEEHFQEDLSLSEIARRQFISPYYFSRLFKQSTGMTVMEFLTSLRMEKAKELLGKTHQSVSQVAGAVGYVDPNYFSRVFKRYIGMSPTEYRRKFHT
ncbi:helix-turn-helix domain-containing protein [Desulfofundulus thermosubterraneus]|uniref:Helix-turn-helix domain-containing protein n=1 Tax=Desulfofundulus thermosubterraneus DSM 16057 TaxID=1121432 RepID=A0A1M6H8K4_9FIRM|nr:helix-turn-helix domain-containing protein [Desulfofundulus thermosubterraneus]SHJ18449.1 Helix-turn-helix domain-containing protein [Desulfofundulus thermosubterraneus DSM 16057]